MQIDYMVRIERRPSDSDTYSVIDKHTYSGLHRFFKANRYYCQCKRNYLRPKHFTDHDYKVIFSIVFYPQNSIDRLIIGGQHGISRVIKSKEVLNTKGLH